MKAAATNSNSDRPAKGMFRIPDFINPSGATAYRVVGWTLQGERIRKNFKDHASAVAHRQELETQNANLADAGRTVFTRLTSSQINEAENAFSALKRAGHTSMAVAVDYFIHNYRDPLKRISTSQAVDLFIAEKRSAKRRQRYLKDLTHELAYLTKAHGLRLVHEWQKEDLVSIIDVQGRGAERQNNIRKDFRTFFNWCLANGYAQSNPAELVPQKTVERGEIQTLPLETVRDLLNAAAGHKGGILLPYVALATFCAIRPDELARLSWEQIDLREKQVTITASAAKKRGRRVVDIPVNCVTWLRPHAKRKVPIKGVNWRKEFDAVRAMIGYGNPAPSNADEEEKKRRSKLKRWPQDVLRHTGISCHYRKYGDEARTASWAGNSPDMIHAHYRALVSARVAADFFEIRPRKRA